MKNNSALSQDAPVSGPKSRPSVRVYQDFLNNKVMQISSSALNDNFSINGGGRLSDGAVRIRMSSSAQNPTAQFLEQNNENQPVLQLNGGDIRASALALNENPSFLGQPQQSPVSGKQPLNFVQLMRRIRLRRVVIELIKKLPSRRYQRLTKEHLQLLGENVDKQAVMPQISQKSQDLRSGFLSDLSEQAQSFIRVKEAVKRNFAQLIKFFERGLIWIDEKIPITSPSNRLYLMVSLVLNLLKFVLVFIITIALATDQPFQDLINISLLNGIIFSTLVDILFNINVAFYKKGRLIKKRRKIIHKYLMHGKPFYDILSYISIFYFRDKWLNETIFNRLFSFVLLIFVVRTILSRDIMQEMQDKQMVTARVRNMFQLGQLLRYIIIVNHCFACVWLYTGLHEQGQFTSITWIEVKGLTEQPWYVQYCYAFYFYTVTMATVGYGDIVPTNTIEVMIVIVSILIACGNFAYSLNEVSAVISDFFREQREIQEKLFIINKYMQKKHISTELQYEIREYLQYFWHETNEEQQRSEEKIIDQLSDTLKYKLLLQANNIVLSDSTIFAKNFSREVIRAMIPIIRELRLAPQQTVYTQGEYQEQNIYFIEHGKIEIFLNQQNQQGKNGQTIKVLKPGEYFGDIQFFTGQAREISAKASQFTVLQYVRRDDFIHLLQTGGFQSDYEKFCLMRDALRFDIDLKVVQKQCELCKSHQHKTIACPLVQYQANRFRVIGGYNQAHQEARNCEDIQRSSDIRISALENINEIQQIALIYKEENEDLFDHYQEQLERDEDYVLFQRKLENILIPLNITEQHGFMMSTEIEAESSEAQFQNDKQQLQNSEKIGEDEYHENMLDQPSPLMMHTQGGVNIRIEGDQSSLHLGIKTSGRLENITEIEENDNAAGDEEQKNSVLQDKSGRNITSSSLRKVNFMTGDASAAPNLADLAERTELSIAAPESDDFVPLSGGTMQTSIAKQRNFFRRQSKKLHTREPARRYNNNNVYNKSPTQRSFGANIEESADITSNTVSASGAVESDMSARHAPNYFNSSVRPMSVAPENSAFKRSGTNKKLTINNSQSIQDSCSIGDGASPNKSNTRFAFEGSLNGQTLHRKNRRRYSINPVLAMGSNFLNPRALISSNSGRKQTFLSKQQTLLQAQTSYLHQLSETENQASGIQNNAISQQRSSRGLQPISQGTAALQEQLKQMLLEIRNLKNTQQCLDIAQIRSKDNDFNSLKKEEIFEHFKNYDFYLPRNNLSYILIRLQKIRERRASDAANVVPGGILSHRKLKDGAVIPTKNGIRDPIFGMNQDLLTLQDIMNNGNTSNNALIKEQLLQIMEKRKNSELRINLESNQFGLKNLNPFQSNLAIANSPQNASNQQNNSQYLIRIAASSPHAQDGSQEGALQQADIGSRDELYPHVEEPQSVKNGNVFIQDLAEEVISYGQIDIQSPPPACEQTKLTNHQMRSTSSIDCARTVNVVNCEEVKQPEADAEDLPDDDIFSLHIPQTHRGIFRNEKTYFVEN